jgi:hypothetical protein
MIYGPVNENQNILGSSSKFLTDLIAGDDVIVQLFEPIEATNTSTLRISRIVHAYRNMFPTNGSSETTASSLSCHNDVACYSNWTTESNGVARLLIGDGTGLCSGALLNNTAQDNKPLFLSAFHCIDTNPYDGNLNDTEKNDPQNWAFRFYYKKTTCSGNVINSYITYNHANFKAAWKDTDFLLVELKNLMIDNSIRFLGWDRSGNTSSSGTGIHHPKGDVMKISFDKS